ncbi:hypothetical protein [Couchioplanes caeruleus]|uniref:Type IV pilus biogenesis protein PilO n=2 Tax=Couchioplanes caeruleus TaxID=56438 RepID=A0A1K0FTS9_9ACTN|nr:hypothetical protein [Couchioplanes caeruleus]OJF16072.1 Type IV pilus biogenesis protein PilO [Couchioplanes caeruleus subsp. caeruleus]ROP29961.1 type IV pilus assembly protein PilO [Couchioplanes caeruleus]
MRTGHAGQLWMIFGFLAAGLLVAVTYFAVIIPTSADTQALADQTDNFTAQTSKLRKDITALKKTEKDKKKLEATRNAYRKALPSTSGIPAFLRQLQTQSLKVGVDVKSLTVSTPKEVKGLANVWDIAIQLKADGDKEKLDDLLELLQASNQKRAVLIESASFEAAEEKETEKDEEAEDKDEDEDEDEEEPDQLSISIHAFVAPPAGSGMPSVTTD